VIYLAIEQIEALHLRALSEFGGLQGLRAPHQLAAAVRQPEQSAFGEDAYPTIADKAAAYGFFIAEAQAFVDGNKRTAAAAMLTFLEINGYHLDQTDDQIADMFEQLGEDRIDQAGFFAWVRQHVTAKPLE
jgi:death-on-curing protein